MAKREEIRMALVGWLAKYDADTERGKTQSVSETIDQIMQVLYSQDVVIATMDCGILVAVEPLIKE